jgi:hypothetical protein
MMKHDIMLKNSIEYCCWKHTKIMVFSMIWMMKHDIMLKNSIEECCWKHTRPKLNYEEIVCQNILFVVL